MKTANNIARLAFGLVLSLSFLASSCSSDDEEDGPTNVITMQNTAIRGSEEVPVNSSQATGTFTGTYDQDTKILSYTITYSGLTATNMHFHRGDVGVSGPVVIPIGAAPFTSPITSQTSALPPEQEAELLGGKWYVNIHSAQFPAGEIRGQVRRQ